MKRKKTVSTSLVSYKKYRFTLKIPEFQISFNTYLFFGLGYLIFISFVIYYFNRPGLISHKYPNQAKVAGESTETNSQINFPKVPVLRNSQPFPEITAESVMVVDVESLSVLLEINSDQKMLPASTTKILTALVSLEFYPLDKVLQVNGNVIDGQRMGLVTGEEITVENLLYGLLIYSANDAAEVLAHNFPGGRDLFVSTMNMKAQELGMENSKFTNPSGLDGDGHYSTARDLIKLSLYAMRIPVISHIVSLKDITVMSVDGKIVHKLRNINQLIGSVDGVIGIKTGWTENAMENLITYIRRDDKELVISVLGSKDRFSDTKKLIDWIYSNYSWD